MKRVKPWMVWVGLAATAAVAVHVLRQRSAAAAQSSGPSLPSSYGAPVRTGPLLIPVSANGGGPGIGPPVAVSPTPTGGGGHHGGNDAQGRWRGRDRGSPGQGTSGGVRNAPGSASSPAYWANALHQDNLVAAAINGPGVPVYDSRGNLISTPTGAPTAATAASNIPVVQVPGAPAGTYAWGSTFPGPGIGAPIAATTAPVRRRNDG